MEEINYLNSTSSKDNQEIINALNFSFYVEDSLTNQTIKIVKKFIYF